MTNYRGTNQMHSACGLRMLPAKGGNDPAFRCRASGDTLVVPALFLGGAGSRTDHQRISLASRTDLKLIRIGS